MGQSITPRVYGFFKGAPKGAPFSILIYVRSK